MRILYGFQATLLASLVIAAVSPLSAAEIRVFSGGAPQQVLRQIAPAFEKQSGHHAEYTFALVTAIQQKLAAGEKADLILLPVPLIAATEKNMPLRKEGRVILARVGIAVIMPEAATPPDISTKELIRKLLLGSRAIAFPEPSTPSGAHLARVITELGIEDSIRPKIKIKAAINGGAELVAKGEADVGMYLLSEVQSTKGIKVAGLLPAPIQSFVTYGSAVPEYNASPDPALAFLKFVADPSQRDHWTAAGFELLNTVPQKN